MEYDQWLEEHIQRQYERDDEVDAEVERLLAEECDPCDIENFFEAMADECFHPFKAQIEKGLNADEPDFNSLGKAVFDALYTYWEARARDKAISTF